MMNNATIATIRNLNVNIRVADCHTYAALMKLVREENHPMQDLEATLAQAFKDNTLYLFDFIETDNVSQLQLRAWGVTCKLTAAKAFAVVDDEREFQFFWMANSLRASGLEGHFHTLLAGAFPRANFNGFKRVY